MDGSSQLEGPRSHRAEIPDKMGKNYKIPLSPRVRPPKVWKIAQKRAKLLKNTIFRPFSAFFALFFEARSKSTWEIQKTEAKGLYPQISSDLLKPPPLQRFSDPFCTFFLDVFLYFGP